MSEVYLSHAGYRGSVEVSLGDDCLFGKILQIRDLVTYEAETVSGLKGAFVESVQHYLAQCEQDGLEPDRPDPGLSQAVPPAWFCAFGQNGWIATDRT
jgi:predicted HicB family RNase H-like nuclease